jgi:uncharacterized protein
MLFKIKEIGDDGLSLNLAITAVWLAVECPNLGAVPGAAGLKLRGRLNLVGDDVLLHGTLRGVLDATCSRCLEPAAVRMDVPMTVTFIARTEDDEDEDDAEKDADVATFDGDKLDLAPEIRDQLLLAYPITPLCRVDCAGLCAVCGGNRNQVACDCPPPQIETRTPLSAALGKLKL